MLELVGLSAMMTIMILLGIAGVVSWGITEMVKRGFLAYLVSTPEDDKAPWWWNTVVRGGAVMVGGVTGFALMHTPIGIGLGLAAGALNTTLVMVIKTKFKGWAKSDDTGDEGGDGPQV